MYNLLVTATTHALIGAAIAAKVPNPALSAGLIFSSHFLLDLIPHWDFGSDWRSRPKFKTGLLAVADTVMGFTLTYFLFASKLPLEWLILAPVLANIPDWLEIPWYIFFAHPKKRQPASGASILEKFSFSIYQCENMFHTKADRNFGILTQLGVLAFFLTLLA